ncbi:Peptidase C39 family protein [Singulisphaera sp. GP187]|uniref:cysteine peptidase family C39 domain-containing protein n=1 Tax=Singulisphaera sp. GP187 TaxID=1882752 RepID=UPI00092A3418|nr:cysteine peptidase family C39 domain-containing protein [Singulisphaera sp. GP187]SIO67219.1 Peptidase C39 family protein [Singulisphaera sp. GP187]
MKIANPSQQNKKRFMFSGVTQWRIKQNATCMMLIISVVGMNFVNSWFAVMCEGSSDLLVSRQNESVSGDERAAQVDGENSHPESPEDKYCGERCLEFLLKFYNIPGPDLIELILQMQSQEVDGLLTFKALRGKMQDFNLYAMPICCKSVEDIEWHEPVILQLSKPNNIKHFVVWIRNKRSGRGTMWDGLLGGFEMDATEVDKTFTGFALLTSADPIDSQKLLHAHQQSYWWFLTVVGLWASVIVFFWKSRKTSFSPY